MKRAAGRPHLYRQEANSSTLFRDNVHADHVESIECEVGAHVSKVMTYPVADTALEAKFCLPYCLGVAVCDGRAGLGQFADSRVRDAQVQKCWQSVFG